MKEEIEWFRPKDKLPEYGEVKKWCGHVTTEVLINMCESDVFAGYHSQRTENFYDEDDNIVPIERMIAWAEMPKGINYE
jgi:hypothetical protein